jgi:hypothetical protein
MKARLITLLAAGSLIGAGFAALPASSALANTYCSDGVNAGVAGNGSTYWGWCHTGGGYVRYRVTIECPLGGGGTTAWASGQGGTVYTESETCWFGQQLSGYSIENG